eukprot:gene5934-9764_t
MGAEDILRRQFDYLDEYFKQLRNVIQEVKNAAPHEKSSRAASAEEIKKNIESILDKKIPRALDRASEDEKDNFESLKQNAEENYNLLKEQLENAKSDDGGNDEPTIDITIPQNQVMDIGDDEEALERQRRAAEKQRMQQEEAEKQKTMEQENPEEIDEVLDIYKQALSSIKNSQAINEETLKIADGIGQKLAEQTEQMERIQEKLDTLGDTIGRAKHEMGTFLKGLATEKITIVVIICIVVILFILFVARCIWWAVDKGKQLFGSNSATAPSNGSK